MEIHIRTAQLDNYEAIESIMKQAQQLHIGWRPLTVAASQQKKQ